jgi:predicted component of type VI protein secretion system
MEAVCDIPTWDLGLHSVTNLKELTVRLDPNLLRHWQVLGNFCEKWAPQSRKIECALTDFTLDLQMILLMLTFLHLSSSSELWLYQSPEIFSRTNSTCSSEPKKKILEYPRNTSTCLMRIENLLKRWWPQEENWPTMLWRIWVSLWPKDWSFADFAEFRVPHCVHAHPPKAEEYCPVAVQVKNLFSLSKKSQTFR